MDQTLTTREAADALVYGRDPILSGILEQTKDRADQKEILEGVIVRLITHLRHDTELSHFRAFRSRRSSGQFPCGEEGFPAQRPC